jgi:hypothetical protein
MKVIVNAVHVFQSRRRRLSRAFNLVSRIALDRNDLLLAAGGECATEMGERDDSSLS